MALHSSRLDTGHNIPSPRIAGTQTGQNCLGGDRSQLVALCVRFRHLGHVTTHGGHCDLDNDDDHDDNDQDRKTTRKPAKDNQADHLSDVSAMSIHSLSSNARIPYCYHNVWEMLYLLLPASVNQIWHLLHLFQLFCFRIHAKTYLEDDGLSKQGRHEFFIVPMRL